MQTSKKRVLGICGLALVAGLTTVAATVPVGATSAGGAVNIVVEVLSVTYETKINTPLDGETITGPIIKVSETHKKANSVKYYLTNVTTGEVFELSEYEVSGTNVDGTTEFTIDLDNYGGYGTYILRSVIEAVDDSNNTVTSEDSIQFVYASPDSPNVPDTGSSSGIGAFYGALNLAKSDILTTGLIGFLTISFIALFVVRKSGRKE